MATVSCFGIVACGDDTGNGGNGGDTEQGGNTGDGENTGDSGNTGVDNSTKLTDKKIYVVGDSTVCDYSEKPDNYYLQRFGYGTQLYNYLNLDNANQVVNLALSGRSSLSFLTEANYTKLKNEIGDGDYLIIGFGR